MFVQSNRTETNYSYEVTEIFVSDTDSYNFSISSSNNLCLRFYRDGFDPANTDLYLIGKDTCDNATLNSYWNIYLQAYGKYFLVTTMLISNETETLSIVGSGPSKVTYTHVTNPLTIPLPITTRKSILFEIRSYIGLHG